MELQNKDLANVYQQFNEDVAKPLSVDEIYSKYLSKKGELNKQLRAIGSYDKDARAIFGKEANLLKRYIEEKIEQSKSSSIKTSKYNKPIDVTAPFDINSDKTKRPRQLNEKGSRHPLTIEMEKVIDIFYEMGFDVIESRQLDDDYHMFESLNFPLGHPARDNWDTFWTEDGLIPPAHTSTMQNRVLRMFKPPIRAVIPGRCFRNEATDSSHEHTLHQVEGVYVDTKVSVGDMIGTIKTYLEAFFETELKVKLQPAFFPFTEPDVEFLISCPFCNQTGCTTCGNTGWMEIMGCGMIHPNVLREGGLDPEVYSGFAWGFGLDRLVMIKHGVADIRWLQSGDLSFLRQF